MQKPQHLFLGLALTLVFANPSFGFREISIPINRGVGVAQDPGEHVFTTCYFKNLSQNSSQTVSFWADHGASEPNALSSAGTLIHNSGMGVFGPDEKVLIQNQVLAPGQTFRLPFHWYHGATVSVATTVGASSENILLPNQIRVRVSEDSGAVQASCKLYMHRNGTAVNLHSPLAVNGGRPF